MPIALVIHIILSLLSLVLTGILVFSPSKQKINYTFALFLGTLATGTYMIFTMHVNILITCLEGLAFMGVVFGGIAIARKRIAAKEIKNNTLE